MSIPFRSPHSSPTMAAGPLAGLDPGRNKCGLVRTDPARERIVEALVLPPEQAWQQLKAWHAGQPRC